MIRMAISPRLAMRTLPSKLFPVGLFVRVVYIVNTCRRASGPPVALYGSGNRCYYSYSVPGRKEKLCIVAWFYNQQLVLRRRSIILSGRLFSDGKKHQNNRRGMQEEIDFSAPDVIYLKIIYCKAKYSLFDRNSPQQFPEQNCRANSLSARWTTTQDPRNRKPTRKRVS